MLLLGVCAVVGVLVSDLASPWADVGAWGAGALALRQAHASRHRNVRRLSVADIATLDGVPLETCRVARRGRLVFLHARAPSGRTHRLAWWPDTLSPARGRALRLALDALTHAATRH